LHGSNPSFHYKLPKRLGRIAQHTLCNGLKHDCYKRAHFRHSRRRTATSHCYKLKKGHPMAALSNKL
jgi:hypothetical protein